MSAEELQVVRTIEQLGTEDFKSVAWNTWEEAGKYSVSSLCCIADTILVTKNQDILQLRGGGI